MLVIAMPPAIEVRATRIAVHVAMMVVAAPGTMHRTMLMIAMPSAI
jgi:hypothetical protein